MDKATTDCPTFAPGVVSYKVQAVIARERHMLANKTFHLAVHLARD